MNESNLSLDKWEQKLEDALLILQKCQEDKGFSGCEACEIFLECDTRSSYVKAVYESMNKGEGGGFEF